MSANDVTQMYRATEPTKAPEKKPMSTSMIILIALCAALAIALVVVVVLGLTGTAFGTTCPAVAAARIEGPPATVAPPTNPFTPGTVEHTIASVPEYDAASLTRHEEAHMTREQPVIEHILKDATFLRTAAPDTPAPSESDSVMPPSTAPSGLHRHIEYVVYINLDDATTKKPIEAEIEKLGLPDFVVKERLAANRNANTALGSFMSHIACLSKALTMKKNALILNDDFRLDVDAPQILESLDSVQSAYGNRWDVVLFDMHANEWQPLSADDNEDADASVILRVLHTTSNSGYLVNKLYAPRLLAYWIQRLRSVMVKERLQEQYRLDDIRTDLQRTDLWVAFTRPFGHGTAVAPMQSIIQQTAFKRKRVAVCHVATNRYNQFVTAIQKDCYTKFLKIHHMEFFLFTDEPDSYSSTTEEGAVLHTYPIDSKGYPRDNLFRFHYILTAADQLHTFDYVYYMDVDYHIYQHPAERLLMVDGIVATAHLHNLVEKRDGTERHLGNPETRPESAACIHPNERMETYYASSFHGGATEPYLQMCKAIRASVDADETKNVTAKWYDESHLNRFLLDHPPESVLSQSYIFSERCLDLQCTDPMCHALRESRLPPVMGGQ